MAPISSGSGSFAICEKKITLPMRGHEGTTYDSTELPHGKKTCRRFIAIPRTASRGHTAS
jgi:hypothetical protein